MTESPVEGKMEKPAIPDELEQKIRGLVERSLRQLEENNR